jgi:hypothetical protein
MKKIGFQFLGTAALLIAISVLLIDGVVPLQAAKAAFCGYGSCTVSCEGENCECGRVEEHFVECWCDALYHSMTC